MGGPVPPVDESHRVMLSALVLRPTRTATDGPRGHAPQTRVGSQCGQPTLWEPRLHRTLLHPLCTGGDDDRSLLSHGALSQRRSVDT